MSFVATHRYVGRLRPDWKDRPCRIITTWRGKGPHNVRIEFEDGSKTICPVRCLRKVKPNA